MGLGGRNGDKERGTVGERIAADYLLNRGYSILQRNFRTRLGEIDIIAEDPSGRIVFVEVKGRRRYSFGLPEEAVDRRKQERICRTALLFLQQRGWLERPARLDVIAVSWHNDGEVEVRHIEDAFALDWW